MAVYTKLTQSEVASHLKKYELGELISCTDILAGIDNSNFILETTTGKFILTIFEKRIKENELPFFINLKMHLAKKGILCPCPILDKRGAAIVDLKDKKAAIVTFLDGRETKNISPNHCFEVGKILAQMHLAAADFSEKRENDLGIKFFRPLFSKFEHLLENYQQNLRPEILENLKFLEEAWNHNLPSAATHLDLFPDNVFFDKNEKACGVIDFYFAANDALIYDFAITMVAWCDSEEKFLQLFIGYETVRKFSEAEKDFLKIALVGAAMRFLLTRLHDLFFTPKDSFVKVKDPQEYLQKLRFFKAQL
jgi:homoserine kinase type II